MSKVDTFLSDFVAPMFRRPKKLQVAALCHRNGRRGKEVLLVTSRGTGRWIIPKGWPIKGMNSPQAAVQEAWEEAGVQDGQAESKSIGSYTYDKTLASGLPVSVQTLVYSVEVGELANDFPEAGERTRKWASPEEAARLVNEPELKTILQVIDY